MEEAQTMKAASAARSIWRQREVKGEDVCVSLVPSALEYEGDSDGR